MVGDVCPERRREFAAWVCDFVSEMDEPDQQKGRGDGGD